MGPSISKSFSLSPPYLHFNSVLTKTKLSLILPNSAHFSNLSSDVTYIPFPDSLKKVLQLNQLNILFMRISNTSLPHKTL